MKKKVRIKKVPQFQAGGVQNDKKYNFQIIDPQLLAPDPSKPLSPTNPMFVDKGTPGLESVRWGLDPNDPRAHITVDPKNVPFISPFQQGRGPGSGDYPQPGRNLPRNPTPATIHSNIYRQFGGDINPDFFAYGGQSQSYGLDLGRGIAQYNNPNGINTNPFNTTDTLQPVSRDGANIEAEKGETIVGDFDQDGQNEHMIVGGKRHSQGGTPLNVPDNSFIFSDTKKLNMKGAEIVPFGKSETNKKSYTPAELAKQYDINKYKAILDNPNSDPISKKTAELMIDNYQDKLAKLSLVQEAKKGFPQGIPDMAQTYLQSLQQPTLPQGSNIQDANKQAPSPANSQGQTFKFGGSSLSKFTDGGDPNDEPIDPYKGGKTKAGRYTPTNQDNQYNRGSSYLQQWEGKIPGISKLDNKTAQGRIYDYMLKNNPDAVKNMWQTYGLTAKGMGDTGTRDISDKGTGKFSTLDDSQLPMLKNAYTDGYFGVRQMDPGNSSVTQIPSSLRGPLLPNPAEAGYLPDAVHKTPSIGNNPVPGIPNFTQPHIPFDYLTPDKLTMETALSNRANIKKYMPWSAPDGVVLPTPTFYDPNRELANNNEQANTQMQYNAEFSGPQSQAARNSQVAGQSASNAANILGRYNNQNVGVANQFAQQDAQTMNIFQDAKTRTQNQLYDRNVIANQQFDNSKLKANDEILKSQINAWDNRASMDAINHSTPYSYVDPTTGRIQINPRNMDFGYNPQQAQQKQLTYRDYYNQAKAEGYSEDNAHKHAFEMTKDSRVTYTDKNMDGQPDTARYSTPFNGAYAPSGFIPR